MTALQNILVTGGAGFIGSAVCRHLVEVGRYRVINADKLTYAGNLTSLASLESHRNYRFLQADIGDRVTIAALLVEEEVDAVMHLAAETHVDRSIDGPAAFIETNIVGTFHLLDATLHYWRTLPPERQAVFRFHHISTDEVFGDLPFDKGMFTENTPYQPSSPYSASKAGSDHLVQAWHHTYGLPVVISNCSNNYGPYHFPEKLIPLAILNALDEVPIPVYAAGANVRDWLYVDDHARALEKVMTKGRVGESYLIGGRAERTNLSVVETICTILDRKVPRREGSYHDLVTFVRDRPGHDRRYAIDPGKAEAELGWKAEESFESGIEKTVDWYLKRKDWWAPLREKNTGANDLGSRDEPTQS